MNYAFNKRLYSLAVSFKLFFIDPVLTQQQGIRVTSTFSFFPLAENLIFQLFVVAYGLLPLVSLELAFDFDFISTE